MKRKLILMIALMLTGLCLHAENKESMSQLYDELERALQQRSLYSEQKEARIDSLKRCIYPSMDKHEMFRLCNAIYQEYYTYRFDSAMVYVEKGKAIATELGDLDYLRLSTIHRSILLTTSGYFSESIQNLQSIDVHALSGDLLTEYYTACEWAYSIWAEYSNDKVYAPSYYKQELCYQDSLIRAFPANSKQQLYWKAENLYRHQRYAEAETIFLKLLEDTPMNVRLYAMLTYGLAVNYKRIGNEAKYEEYLVRAAISDQMCPLKENLALQELALYIIENNDDDAARANRYLGYSMEDALFYNNRLRMLEIAQKFPPIVQTYQKQSRIKSQRLQLMLIGISLLAVGLIVSLYFIYRQMRLSHKQKKILAEMNGKLELLNKELVDTNRTREQYVSLFMDLCAAYIDKLNRYQDLVKRKVKAKQTDDLLKLVNSTRLSETDSKEFFFNFDTAFLNLYPDFIPSFNALLREGEEIVPKRGEVLNTELRIFALIRMGIKDSSKIATLLFYSPQTIYNHRSTVKNKAKDRENFEKQVEGICRVI
ncbi:MAG: DUF6377 domain-containing protein [Bacteroides sp.]|nr:DUF6377 domain-containing protein [Bacteroides sp.]